MFFLPYDAILDFVLAWCIVGMMLFVVRATDGKTGSENYPPYLLIEDVGGILV